jgi:hypothetical protein
METGLAALQGVGITEAEKLSLLLLVNGYVRYDAILRGEMAEAARSDGRTVDAVIGEYAGMMRHLVQADRFPLLRQAIDGGAMDQPDNAEADFAFGLSRTLDGIAAFIERLKALIERWKARTGPGPRARSAERPGRRRA